ncbi:hypothetical protein IMZ48_26395 [Candidatus Bathyarchaeota archaeon]|nr:hypothetical protein [Candidatus Bathyarchaeota archaeon]
MLYLIYSMLVLVVFLIVFNGFLNGTKKSQIDVVLSLFLIPLLISAFFAGGSVLGLLGLVIAFLSAIAARPFAARLASKFFAKSAGSNGHYPGFPHQRLQTISRELGKPLDPSKFAASLFTEKDNRDDAENALFDYCAQQPSTNAILKEFNVSRHELQELFHRLLMSGAAQWACGHWVAASTFAYPESLRYLLSRRGKPEIETAYNLIMHFERGSTLSE